MNIIFSSRRWERAAQGGFPEVRHSGRRYGSWDEAATACIGSEWAPCWCWDGSEADPEAWVGYPPSRGALALLRAGEHRA